MDERWVMFCLAGLLSGPMLRGLIFRHSVEAGQPWQQRCPSCDRVILLVAPRGRCRCGHRLGPPFAVVEIVAAVVLAALAWRVSDVVPLLAFGFIALIGVALAFIDVAVHRLPDRLTLPAFAGGAGILALAGQPGRLGIALLCSLAMTAFYLVLILVSPSGMGLGDGKLALSLGLALGWFGGIVTVYGAAAGFILSGLYAVLMLAIGRIGRRDSIAHGPFMLLGALVTLLLLSS